MNERFKELRDQAEMVLKNSNSPNSDTIVNDFHKIIHDLRVYQIELELQNEELRNTQTQLENSKNSYAELYNQSPAGYVTLDQNSIILQANQTFMNMVDKDSSEVFNVSFADFLDNEDRSVFLARFNAFFRSPTEKNMELKLERKGGKTVFIKVTGNLLIEAKPKSKEEVTISKLFLIVMDITSEKEAERQLVESENNYRTLANSGSALIWSSGKNKLYNYFNDVWLKFTGRTLEQENGNGWTQGIHPEDLDRCISIYTNAFEQRESFSMEFRLRRQDGEYRWMLDEARPRFNSQGDFIGYIGYCFDITKRKETELALKERNKELSCLSAVRFQMQENISIDEFCEKILKLITPAMQFPEITYPMIELKGKIYSHGRSDKLLTQYLQSEIKIGKDVIGHLRVYYSDYSPFILPEEQELVDSVANAIQVFIARKKTDQTLLEYNTRLTLGMRVANMAWWEMDPVTGFVSFDKKKAEMLDYPPERFKHYKDFTDLLHPEDYTKAMNAMLEHMNGQLDRYEVEYRILSRSGEYKWFLDIGSIVKWDSFGKPLTVIGLVMNITDRKNAETKLIELNATKDKFFSILAHDLKGPIGSLHSSFDYLASIDDDSTGEQFKRFLPLLKESTESISTLLENLLVWARSQKGDIPYNPSRYNFNNIIRSNMQLFLTTAKRKNVILASKLEKEFYSFFDMDMITTVIRNLINNALKYTRENDTILVSVQELENKLEVSVEDSGIGMRKSTLETLFRIDVRHHSIAGTSGEKGTGLGLILCKEFLDKHNEKIWVTSELGKGSKFTFTLPKATLVANP